METREHLWAEAMRAERQGNAVAYQRLLKEIADLLRKLVRHRLGQLGLQTYEAEDLVQEILIGLHEKRHTWDSDKPFMPWLFAITRYKLIDGARRMRRDASRRLDLTFEDLAEIAEAPAEDFDRTLLDLEHHLSKLPQGQQTVVRALAIEGASVKTTAGRLKTSEGAIRVTFHRALSRLKAAAQREKD